MAVPEHASSDARGRRMQQVRTGPLGSPRGTGAASTALGRSSSPSMPIPLSREARTAAVTAVIDDFRPPAIRGSDVGGDGEVGVVAMPPSVVLTFETRR
jgi:hypothetical protein